MTIDWKCAEKEEEERKKEEEKECAVIEVSSWNLKTKFGDTIVTNGNPECLEMKD